MVYLTAALCCSALIAIMMRLGEHRIKNNISVLAVNYLICLILSLAYTIAATGAGETGTGSFIVHSADGRETQLMGLVNGFFYVGGFILYQYNIRKNGVTMSATFMKLGVLVPTLTAIIVFGERPGRLQICGIILAVAAILVLNLSGKYGKSGKTDKTDSSKSSDITVTTPKALIALLLMGGSGDAMSKIYEELGSSDLNEHFLLYTFISAIILCTMAAVWSRQGLTRDDVLFGCLIGIPNFYTARFLLAALAYVPAVIVYPTYSTGTIILVSIAGVLIFHEKITPKQKTAILMIITALILLNL